MNLLINAIDELKGYNKNNRHIIISTSILEKKYIQISIEDNGRGIQEDIKNKLFDPFFTTKPVGKGTGLGLSVSYQIVEQHGGKLYCISQANEGSKFLIEIPIKLCKSIKGKQMV